MPVATPPDVRSLLPHRGAFLLVDRILEWDAARIRCLKNVSSTDPHLEGHFPDEPIFPGVLLIEACAQAGGILLGLSGRFTTRGYLAEVCEFKFLARVVPGDAVELHAEFVSAIGSFARARVHATVAGRTVARGVVSYFFARG
ncbi:MAG: 3-hydroxyacyl-ACP dehydratase FabZ [Gemmatimonadaceae bacterium]